MRNIERLLEINPILRAFVDHEPYADKPVVTDRLADCVMNHYAKTRSVLH
jgi:hypothetical protein